MQRMRPLLGTFVAIGVNDAVDDGIARAAIDAAFAVVERVQQQMSTHDRCSALSRLNRAACQRATPVDPALLPVLKAAFDFARRSEGAFDPTCLWRSGADARARVQRGGSYRDVELSDDGRLRLHRPLQIDLGGIAKGHAVDLAIEALLAAGLQSVSVNAGGDLRVVGHQPVSLRHSATPAAVPVTVFVRDAALATSATYAAEVELRSAPVHLVDPHRRVAYDGHTAVSVRAGTCLTADALTKVVLFAPPALATAVLAHYDAEAWISGKQDALRVPA